jgi:hypothetical protein
MTQGKTTEELGVRKAAEKTQNFDARKEKQMFEEARKEFRRFKVLHQRHEQN